LRKIDAVQQFNISQYETKFRQLLGHQMTIQNINCARLSNSNALREGYLQQQGEKIFTSPWKRRVSPVACAQPDK
jgi:hypothetical protein